MSAQTVTEAKTELAGWLPPDLLKDLKPEIRAWVVEHLFTTSNPTEANLRDFFWQVRRLGLNAFQGLVKAKERRKPGGERELVLLTTVEGARAIAQASGRLAGIDAPEIEGTTDRPALARCTVKVWDDQARKCEFSAQVYLSEFERDTKFWREQPAHMLGIRAEWHALKKSFPDLLGNLQILWNGEDEGERTQEQKEKSRQQIRKEVAKAFPEARPRPVQGLPETVARGERLLGSRPPKHLEEVPDAEEAAS